MKTKNIGLVKQHQREIVCVNKNDGIDSDPNDHNTQLYENINQLL